MSNKTKGLILSFVLSVVVLFLFFGKILQNPDGYYFSGNGDGFKAYYGAMYHLNYDSTIMRMNGMNYPYGEMVFFTGSQPGIVNSVKFISNYIVDIREHVVGIMNVLMLFSLILAALFIYLIFIELGVAWWYGAVAAVGITILSPQIARLGGHFSLAYLMWIPLMIWLVLRFDRKRTLLLSLVIAFVVFAAGVMHMYFLGFFGFIIGFYWLYRVINLKKDNGSQGQLITGFLVQYVLPVVAIQLLISLNDNVTDRTAYPYGFFAYRGHPIAIFFPSGRPYAFVREWLPVFDHIGWEALAFIGMAATAGFIAGLVYVVKKMVTLKKFWQITDIPVLDTLFWGSFAALLLSFGIPFIFGMEWLVDAIGPIKQLRALARFSWLFYYMLNIVVFYQLYRKAFETRRTAFWKVLAVAGFAFLLFDGSWNIYLNSRNLQNRIPQLEDVMNETEMNEWVNHINPDDYQAILPIPYFHVGSENIWIESRENIQELTMIASLKTGLPTTAVQLSRTSIDQTYRNYKLVTEPLQPFEVLDDLPNQKPFLLLYKRSHYPDENEERLIRHGELVYQNPEIELRKLPVEVLRNLWKEHRQEAMDQYNQSQLYQHNGFLVSDSSAFFIYKSYDDKPAEFTYSGSGALTYQASSWFTVLEDTLKNVPAGEKMIASFWMYGFKQDGFLRANLEIIQKDLNQDQVTGYIYTDVHRHIEAFYDDWALIEIEFETKSESERIKISLRNNVVKNKNFILDELVLREKSVDVYVMNEDYNLINSRKW